LLAQSEGDHQAARKRVALTDQNKAKPKIRLRFQKMRKTKEKMRTEKNGKSLLPSAVAAATYRRRQNKTNNFLKIMNKRTLTCTHE